MVSQNPLQAESGIETIQLAQARNSERNRQNPLQAESGIETRCQPFFADSAYCQNPLQAESGIETEKILKAF